MHQMRLETIQQRIEQCVEMWQCNRKRAWESLLKMQQKAETGNIAYMLPHFFQEVLYWENVLAVVRQAQANDAWSSPEAVEYWIHESKDRLALQVYNRAGRQDEMQALACVINHIERITQGNFRDTDGIPFA